MVIRAAVRFDLRGVSQDEGKKKKKKKKKKRKKRPTNAALSTEMSYASATHSI